MWQLWVVGTLSNKHDNTERNQKREFTSFGKNVLRASCNRSSSKSRKAPDAMNAPEVVFPCSFTHYITTVSAAFQTL